ncbi:hypothetical protein RUM44_010973 [Polyplax serrata]|uniref:Uncharacterized protein n=1 Tax=Polyplax serrata TaxID=468196 RepID=A0ABR1ANP8_POLSC
MRVERFVTEFNGPDHPNEIECFDWRRGFLEVLGIALGFSHGGDPLKWEAIKMGFRYVGNELVDDEMRNDAECFLRVGKCPTIKSAR